MRYVYNAALPSPTGSSNGSATAASPLAAAQATPEEFRAALGQLASGVVLLAAHDPEDGPRGEDVGMTATAFLSVSLEPPLVMVSVREDSRMEEALTRVDHWAVSILSSDQRTAAARFAMKGRVSDRLLFADLPHHRGEISGAPLVDGALATVECRTEQRIPAGDHVLLIGRVLSARIGKQDGAPLVYFRGQYRQLG
ncbi:flavin reductase (DIM6/NTAB) family NADH-FMN oxidoreductase RutF [Streptacidiphilus sp. MAP12-16]